MRPIGPDGFEALFKADIDPWNYAASPFEAFKRRVLLHACGAAARGRVLELACANGETTKALAPKSLRLLAVDGSPSALAEAKRRTRGSRCVTLRIATLPAEMPRGPFDLVVVSELLYYLDRRALRRVLQGIERGLAPGGRVVILHHLRHFADASQPPLLVHARAKAFFGRRMRPTAHGHHGRFEVMAFDRRLPVCHPDIRTRIRPPP